MVNELGADGGQQGAAPRGDNSSSSTGKHDANGPEGQTRMTLKQRIASIWKVLGEHSGAWTAVATIVMALTTGIYTYYAKRQWQEMHSTGEQNDKLIDAAVRQANAAKALALAAGKQAEGMSSSLAKTDEIIRQATRQAKSAEVQSIATVKQLEVAGEVARLAMGGAKVDILSVSTFRSDRTRELGIAPNLKNVGTRPAKRMFICTQLQLNKPAPNTFKASTCGPLEPTIQNEMLPYVERSAYLAHTRNPTRLVLSPSAYNARDLWVYIHIAVLYTDYTGLPLNATFCKRILVSDIISRTKDGIAAGNGFAFAADDCDKEHYPN